MPRGVAEIRLRRDCLARGEIDFWANSWYPGHLAWHELELLDGSEVGDHVTIVGEQMISGGLQGFLINKSFADEHGVYTLDELNRNVAALTAFDAADVIPGNGKADIFGCPTSWTCDNIIENMIAFGGWENISQITIGYDTMFAEAVAKVDRGVPVVIYTWTPSAYIARLRPGDNVYWMGMEQILDDSNPAQPGARARAQPARRGRHRRLRVTRRRPVPVGCRPAQPPMQDRLVRVRHPSHRQPRLPEGQPPRPGRCSRRSSCPLSMCRWPTWP